MTPNETPAVRRHARAALICSQRATVELSASSLGRGGTDDGAAFFYLQHRAFARHARVAMEIERADTLEEPAAAPLESDRIVEDAWRELAALEAEREMRGERAVELMGRRLLATFERMKLHELGRSLEELARTKPLDEIVLGEDEATVVESELLTRTSIRLAWNELGVLLDEGSAARAFQGSETLISMLPSSEPMARQLQAGDRRVEEALSANPDYDNRFLARDLGERLLRPFWSERRRFAPEFRGTLRFEQLAWIGREAEVLGLHF